MVDDRDAAALFGLFLLPYGECLYFTVRMFCSCREEKREHERRGGCYGKERSADARAGQQSRVPPWSAENRQEPEGCFGMQAGGAVKR